MSQRAYASEVDKVFYDNDDAIRLLDLAARTFDEK